MYITCIINNFMLFYDYFYLYLFIICLYYCLFVVPLLILQPIVTAVDHYYHHSCFVCATCGTSLANQDGFNFEDNQLYCKNCFDQSYGTTCHGCKQNISANDLWVEALDNNWHPQCFVCTVSRVDLSSKCV